ncbi:MAG: hypothetical protein IPH60_18650 [Flavobacteriales bacterium]|nr:hypothetical protein [Flavobacteriales bacterium]
MGFTVTTTAALVPTHPLRSVTVTVVVTEYCCGDVLGGGTTGTPHVALLLRWTSMDHFHNSSPVLLV